MQPLTVVCNARKPGGIQHRVRKAVYEIECPKCGRRTQIEKAEHSQPQGYQPQG